MHPTPDSSKSPYKHISNLCSLNWLYKLVEFPIVDGQDGSREVVVDSLPDLESIMIGTEYKKMHKESMNTSSTQSTKSDNFSFIN